MFIISTVFHTTILLIWARIPNIWTPGLTNYRKKSFSRYYTKPNPNQIFPRCSDMIPSSIQSSSEEYNYNVPGVFIITGTIVGTGLILLNVLLIGFCLHKRTNKRIRGLDSLFNRYYFVWMLVLRLLLWLWFCVRIFENYNILLIYKLQQIYQKVVPVFKYLCFC